MDKQLKEKLRLFKVSVLYVLNTLASTESMALELNEISDSTSTPEVNLQGILSSLRRVKVRDEPLIMPAGRDDDGRLRWKINEAAVDKNELAKFLEEEILGQENIKRP